MLRECGGWERRRDGKLMALWVLLQIQHSDQKVLVFTQFADTARYLESALRAEGVSRLAIASGDSADPTEVAWRFSLGVSTIAKNGFCRWLRSDDRLFTIQEEEQQREQQIICLLGLFQKQSVYFLG